MSYFIPHFEGSATNRNLHWQFFSFLVLSRCSLSLTFSNLPISLFGVDLFVFSSYMEFFEQLICVDSCLPSNFGLLGHFYKYSLSFFLSVLSFWDSHHVCWSSWSFSKDPLGSVLCSLFFSFFFFLSFCSTDQIISIVLYSSLLILSHAYLNLQLNSLVKFSFQLLYFLTPEFPYGSFS